MAGTTRDPNGLGSVEIVRVDDGTISARVWAAGLARGGDTRAESLIPFAEVLELHEGGAASIDDPDERSFLGLVYLDR